MVVEISSLAIQQDETLPMICPASYVFHFNGERRWVVPDNDDHRREREILEPAKLGAAKL